MTNLTTLNEVEELLLAYTPSRMSGADYQLERIGGLLAHLGNPQNDLKVVHIAGTSGKTSTAYYTRAILESTGVSVGLTVSPHIQSICERIQLDGGPIPESQFIRYFQEFYPLILDFEPRPTYFELMTAFAYWVFKKEQVDYAVIEVGLGGRYDATNTISRADKVSVINSIGYDHTEIFGETLTEIANEKAGIIQDGNVVFTVDQDAEARVVIDAEVAKKNASLTVITPEIDSSSAVPPFQQQNFALAYAAVDYVAHRDGLVVPADASQIINHVTVPGRFEIYTVGDKTVLLDGAHNPQKLEALIDVLRQKNMQPAVVVAAFSEAPEKKMAECVRLVSSFAKRTIYTTFTVQRDVTRRSASLAELSKLSNGQSECIEQPAEALERALISGQPFVIVTGSLYLVSILRPIIQNRAGF